MSGNVLATKAFSSTFIFQLVYVSFDSVPFSFPFLFNRFYYFPVVYCPVLRSLLCFPFLAFPLPSLFVFKPFFFTSSRRLIFSTPALVHSKLSQFVYDTNDYTYPNVGDEIWRKFFEFTTTHSLKHLLVA